MHLRFDDATDAVMAAIMAAKMRCLSCSKFKLIEQIDRWQPFIVSALIFWNYGILFYMYDAKN